MRKSKHILPTTAYRLGMQVQACVYGDIVVGKVEGLAGREILVTWENHVGKYLEDYNVTPICRRINSLTEEEAKRCYQIRHGKTFSTRPTFQGEKKRKALEHVTYSDYLDGISMSDIDIALWDIAVADYLESIGIDTRGWIDKGLAIDEATLK